MVYLTDKSAKGNLRASPSFIKTRDYYCKGSTHAGGHVSVVDITEPC